MRFATKHVTIRVLLALILIPVIADVRAADGRRETSPVGYPSVAAALSDLRQKAGVTMRDWRGWTVAEDTANKTIWSFTPQGHPAHPAVVKRQVVEEGGVLKVKTDAICEAKKPDCDRLIAQFQALARQAQQALSKGTTAPVAFRPSEQQAAMAKEAVSRFLQALDEARYGDAYSQLAPSLKSIFPFEKFEVLEVRFRERAGGTAVRSGTRITWYKNPPRAPAKGVYAAFDLKCVYPNINICKETIILHQQPTGRFLVLRHSRNTIGKDAEKRIRERQSRGDARD